MNLAALAVVVGAGVLVAAMVSLMVLLVETRDLRRRQAARAPNDAALTARFQRDVSRFTTFFWGSYSVCLALAVSTPVVVGALFRLWLPLPFQTLYPALGVLAAIGWTYALLRALRAPPEWLPGVEVTDQDEPALFALVREVAKATGVAPFEVVRLTPDSTFATYDVRVLLVGFAALGRFSVEEIRGILAHEYGHAAAWEPTGNRSVRACYSTVAWRKWEALPRLTWMLNPFAALLTLYAHALASLQAAWSRRTELEADDFAARAVGNALLARAVRAAAYGGDLSARAEQIGLTLRAWGFAAKWFDVEREVEATKPPEWAKAEAEGQLPEPKLEEYDSHFCLQVHLARLGNAAAPSGATEPGADPRLAHSSKSLGALEARTAADWDEELRRANTPAEPPRATPPGLAAEVARGLALFGWGVSMAELEIGQGPDLMARGLAQVEAVLGEEDPLLVQMLCTRAEAVASLGSRDEAEPLLQRASALAESALITRPDRRARAKGWVRESRRWVKQHARVGG